MTGRPYAYASDDPVNTADPSGLISLSGGGCGGASGEAGLGPGGSAQGELCLNAGFGWWAVTESYGGGVTTGAGVSGSLTLGGQVDSASSPQELSGCSVYGQVSGVAGGGGYGSVSTDCAGRGSWSFEGGLQTGAGADVEGGAGLTKTCVVTSSTGYSDCQAGPAPNALSPLGFCYAGGSFATAGRACMTSTSGDIPVQIAPAAAANSTSAGNPAACNVGDYLDRASGGSTP